MYRIELKKSAKKEFLTLPSNIQNKILEALQFLSQNPYSELLQVKKLKGTEHLYRIRIGDYRIIYEIQKGKLVVIIIKIGHRSDVYR